MFRINADSFVSIFAMGIPIVAIIGGITVAIVRTIGQQRLAEREPPVAQGAQGGARAPARGLAGDRRERAREARQPEDRRQRSCQQVAAGDRRALLLGVRSPRR